MNYFKLEFIVLFAITFPLYILNPTKNRRFWILLLASSFFYAWAGALDTLIFAFVILCSWLAVALGQKYPASRLAFISVGVILMTLHLFFWKYASWITDQIQSLHPGFLSGRELALPLPVGISFFTLQGIAYLVDYYRGQARYMSLGRYILFKSFFPQLVAGPIVRSKQLSPQIEALPTPTSTDIATGLSLFIMGFAKKLLLADKISAAVDPVFAAPAAYNRLALISAAVLYSLQIWADFSAYTDMGRGTARMLGFVLPENFLSPYLALSPSEFWKRWHITLSQWIRDYIYIPMGGNRGSGARVAIVTMTTMAISGLWHGANWTFLLWGVYHGFLLLLERGIRAMSPVKIQLNFTNHLISWALMSVLTIFGWIIFRAESFHILIIYVKGLFSSTGSLPPLLSWNRLAAFIFIAMAIQITFYIDFKTGEYLPLRIFKSFSNSPPDLWLRKPIVRQGAGVLGGMALAGLFILVLLKSSGNAKPFIYFQF